MKRKAEEKECAISKKHSCMAFQTWLDILILLKPTIQKWLGHRVLHTVFRPHPSDLPQYQYKQQVEMALSQTCRGLHRIYRPDTLPRFSDHSSSWKYRVLASLEFAIFGQPCYVKEDAKEYLEFTYKTEVSEYRIVLSIFRADDGNYTSIVIESDSKDNNDGDGRQVGFGDCGLLQKTETTLWEQGVLTGYWRHHISILLAPHVEEIMRSAAADMATIEEKQCSLATHDQCEHWGETFDSYFETYVKEFHMNAYAFTPDIYKVPRICKR